jgi:hypothetical protein
VAIFGTGSVATIAAADAGETRTVTNLVKGFSCATCAVGLDTMLQKQKGIVWSKSTYPEWIVKIKFDPQEVNEESLEGFIWEMGFTVTDERPSGGS